MKINAKLKLNMQNIYGEKGKQWLVELPVIAKTLATHWKLDHLIPLDNMTFHFVATATTVSQQPVVLKIGLDKKVIASEMQALKFFDGQAAVQFIDYHPEYNALLLQQAIPGHSLKSLYLAQVDDVMDKYVETMNKLHNKSFSKNENFLHVQDWLIELDNVDKNKLPKNLLTKAIKLKNELLSTQQKNILLHGDLHHDNILKHGNEWIVIDPKGIIGEPEFEIAAFDFIHPSEFASKDVKKLFQDRVEQIAKKSHLNSQRIKDWVFVRIILSAVWSIEDHGDPAAAINLAKLID